MKNIPPAPRAQISRIIEAVLNFSKKFFLACVLRQIARYLPHHRSENASKTHPKSSHDKFKTAS